MKKLLFLLLLSSKCFAQETVTVEQLKSAIIHMSMELKEADKEFNVGMYGYVGGLCLSAVGAGIYFTDGPQYGATMLVIGIAAQLASGIVMMNAHRHIGRAGNIRFNGTSVTMNF